MCGRCFTHMRAGASQAREVLELLKLQLQAVRSHLPWVLGIRLGPSARARGPPKHRVIFSDTLIYFQNKIVLTMICYLTHFSF